MELGSDFTGKRNSAKKSLD
ncbi:hypothetical protein R3I94_004443 [Phoxinus phoxinus]